MEEVVSSNLTRSTKTFHRLSVLFPFCTWLCGVQLESKPLFGAWASLGMDVVLDAAHDWRFRFNVIRHLGSVGTAFCTGCPAETTTMGFLYRRCPSLLTFQTSDFLQAPFSRKNPT